MHGVSIPGADRLRHRAAVRMNIRATCAIAIAKDKQAQAHESDILSHSRESMRATKEPGMQIAQISFCLPRGRETVQFFVVRNT